MFQKDLIVTVIFYRKGKQLHPTNEFNFYGTDSKNLDMVAQRLESDALHKVTPRKTLVHSPRFSVYRLES